MTTEFNLDAWEPEAQDAWKAQDDATVAAKRKVKTLVVVIESTESAAVGGFAKCPCCGIAVDWQQARCLCGVGLYWQRMETMNAELSIRELARDRDAWRTLAETQADEAATLRAEVEMLRNELDHWKRYGCAIADNVPAFLRKQN